MQAVGEECVQPLHTANMGGDDRTSVCMAFRNVAYNTLTNAAREGARIAIVNQDKPTIIERAKNATAIVELEDPSVSVAFWQMAPNGTPNTSDPCNLVSVGCLAVVSFEATYVPITPFVSNIVFADGVTFTAESILSVEYRCPNDDFPTPDLCPKQP